MTPAPHPPKAQVAVQIHAGNQIRVHREGMAKITALGYLVLGLILLARSILPEKKE